MTIFNKIINKVIHLDNNIFSPQSDKNDNVKLIYKVFFLNLINNSFYPQFKNKFEYMNDVLNNFYFINNDVEKNAFIGMFCRVQCLYHALNNFIIQCKYKRAKVIVNADLQLNQIDSTHSNTICIYHLRSKYLFKMEDLMKHIYMSLTNCHLFFAEPIAIKNPYNNVPFDKAILYYINLHLILKCKINLIKPKYIDLFFKFRDCHFNMTKFVNNYEHILREHSIENFLNNSANQLILSEIRKMIETFNNYFVYNICKINISDEFPVDILIKIMKPYLKLKLFADFSLIEKNRIDCMNLFIKKLFEFQRFNPQFGRKIIKYKDVVQNNNVKRIKSHFEFITKHKNFYDYDITNFMKDHLSYCPQPEIQSINGYVQNIIETDNTEQIIEDNEYNEYNENNEYNEHNNQIENDEWVDDDEADDNSVS